MGKDVVKVGGRQRWVGHFRIRLPRNSPNPVSGVIEHFGRESRIDADPETAFGDDVGVGQRAGDAVGAALACRAGA